MHRRKCSNSTNWDWGWWFQYCPSSTIRYGAFICPVGHTSHIDVVVW